MSDHVYEIEVKARNAAGQESTVHAELTTPTANPHDAAREMVDVMVKKVGNNKMREIDSAR